MTALRVSFVRSAHRTALPGWLDAPGRRCRPLSRRLPSHRQDDIGGTTAAASAARRAALPFVIAGLLALDHLARIPGNERGFVALLGLGDLAIAAGFRWVPWRRWPARTTLVVVPVAMAMALLFAAVLHGARIAHLRARMCPHPGVPTSGGGGYQEAVGRLGAPTAVGPDGWTARR
jgi:hypothetical protein